jgi:hypothetical protein
MFNLGPFIVLTWVVIAWYHPLFAVMMLTVQLMVVALEQKR